MKRIKVDLFDLDKLNTELDNYAKQVDYVVNVALKDLAKQAETYMKSVYVAGHPQGQSNGDNIITKTIPDGYRIEDTSPYAEFAEYGTGIKGANSPHPEPPTSWVYNRSNKPYWWYPTDASDPNTSKFKSISGDYIAATKGVIGSAHAWKTYQWLNQIAVKELNSKVGDIK